MDSSGKKMLVIHCLYIFVILVLAGLAIWLWFNPGGQNKSVSDTEMNSYETQIQDLTAQNKVLADELATMQKLSDDSLLYSNADEFLHAMFEGDYYLYDIDQHYEQKNSKLTPMCTEAGRKAYCPKDVDTSWVHEPVPVKPSEAGSETGEVKYYENYRSVDKVLSEKIFFRREDSSHAVVLSFVERNHDQIMPVSDERSEETTKSTVNTIMMNFRMVYSEEDSRLACGRAAA